VADDLGALCLQGCIFSADPIRSADNRQQPLRHGQTHQTNTGECQAGSDADITNSSSIKQAVILTQLDCCAYARQPQALQWLYIRALPAIEPENPHVETYPGRRFWRCPELYCCVRMPPRPYGFAIPDEAPTELLRKFKPLGAYLEQQPGMPVFVP
jgi:hypothetical protein